MTKLSIRRSRSGLLQALLLGFLLSSGLMVTAAKAQITTVFYILLENRCFTTGTDTSYNNIIKGNSAAPYLNSLVTPGNPAAAQVSYATAYHNDVSLPNGSNLFNVSGGVHPSEPNYVWMEAGNNLSKYDDNDPYGSTNSVAQIANYLAANPGLTGENFCALLQNNGISWRAYVEGTGLLNSNGLDFNTNTTSGGATLTNNVAPLGTRTVPLVSFSGNSTTYTNEYNGTHQYNFAVKHTGSLFFPATNGSTVTTANTSATNIEISHYAPLEQLTTDLNNNTVAAYNVITPDQYNDGHTALATSFTYHGTTYTAGADIERIAQMDNFCSIVVPQIQASANYAAGHTAIVIWTDETEGTPVRFLLDAGHAYRGGADVIGLIGRRLDQIAAFHMRDFVNKKEVPLGQGSFPLAQFAAVLRNRRWTGWALNEEDNDGGQKLGLAVIEPAFHALSTALG